MPLVGRYEVGILLKHHLVTAITPTGIAPSNSKGPTAAKSTAEGHTANNSCTTTLRAKPLHQGLRRREQHHLHCKCLAAPTATKISNVAKSPTTEGPTIEGRMNHQLKCLPRVEITLPTSAICQPFHRRLSAVGGRAFDDLALNNIALVAFGGVAFGGVAFGGVAFDSVVFDGVSFKCVRQLCIRWFVFDAVAFDVVTFDGVTFDGLAFGRRRGTWQRCVRRRLGSIAFVFDGVCVRRRLGSTAAFKFDGVRTTAQRPAITA